MNPPPTVGQFGFWHRPNSNLVKIVPFSGILACVWECYGISSCFPYSWTPQGLHLAVFTIKNRHFQHFFDQKWSIFGISSPEISCFSPQKHDFLMVFRQKILNFWRKSKRGTVNRFLLAQRILWQSLRSNHAKTAKITKNYWMPDSLFTKGGPLCIFKFQQYLNGPKSTNYVKKVPEMTRFDRKHHQGVLIDS